MLKCDCCETIIEELTEDELTAQNGDTDTDELPDAEAEGTRRRRSRKKKESPVPTKRPSLVTLPFRRTVNGYDYKDFDLCPACREKLDKKAADVAFAFTEEFQLRRYFIVPEDKWEEGVEYIANDADSAVRAYNAESCVNVDVDVFRAFSGGFEYCGSYALREDGYAPA